MTTTASVLPLTLIRKETFTGALPAVTANVVRNRVQFSPERFYSVTARSGLSGVAVKARATLPKPCTDFDDVAIRSSERPFSTETEAVAWSAPLPPSNGTDTVGGISIPAPTRQIAVAEITRERMDITSPLHPPDRPPTSPHGRVGCAARSRPEVAIENRDLPPRNRLAHGFGSDRLYPSQRLVAQPLDWIVSDRNTPRS